MRPGEYDKLANKLLPFILSKVRQASRVTPAAIDGDMSATEILTAILSLDGPGSLLDADTVDGSHASEFIFNSLLTTRGDLIRRGASVPERYGLVVPASPTINYLGVANGETAPAWKSASSNPGAAALLLQSNASGVLQLQGLIAPYVRPAADSTTALQLQNAAGTPILTVDTTNGQTALRTGRSGPTLGSELTTNGGFTSDLTGWSGANWAWEAGADGQARHAAGSTVALTQNISVTSGTTYEVAWTITGRTAGAVAFSVGGISVLAGASSTFSATNTGAFVASGTGSQALNITPTTDFDGALTIISVKAVTANSIAAVILQDEVGVTRAEWRGDTLGNFAIGNGAGRRFTSGTSNTAVGTLALASATRANRNMAFGDQALRSLISGSDNTAIGALALSAATTGSSNTALGYAVLGVLTTGTSNVAIGGNALVALVSGVGNVAIGESALRAASANASTNVAIGNSALFNLGAFSQNVAIGTQAGRYHADGSTALTTTSNSIYIGAQARGKNNSDSNSIVIGYIGIGLGANTTVIGNSSTTLAKIWGSLTITGGLVVPVATKSADYTLTAADNVVVFTATATATLPAATGSGQTYRIICRAGALTIDGNGADVIKGATTAVLAPGEDFIITDTGVGIYE